LVSDRGTAFTSREFSEFLKSRNIKHRQIAVAAPWANGLVERINRFLKTSLQKIVDENNLWSDKLSVVQYVINNTFHSSLKASLSKLLLGYDQRDHTDVFLVNYLNKIAKVHLDCKKERNESQDLASEIRNKIKNYNKLYYDHKHVKPTLYKEGDYVLIRDTILKPEENKKLKSSYKGPYMVVKILNNNRYVIKDIPGFNISSRPYNSVLSTDRMKPWVKPIPP